MTEPLFREKPTEPLIIKKPVVVPSATFDAQKTTEAIHKSEKTLHANKEAEKFIHGQHGLGLSGIPIPREIKTNEQVVAWSFTQSEETRIRVLTAVKNNAPDFVNDHWNEFIEHSREASEGFKRVKKAQEVCKNAPTPENLEAYRREVFDFSRKYNLDAINLARELDKTYGTSFAPQLASKVIMPPNQAPAFAQMSAMSIFVTNLLKEEDKKEKERKEKSRQAQEEEAKKENVARKKQSGKKGTGEEEEAAPEEGKKETETITAETKAAATILANALEIHKLEQAIKNDGGNLAKKLSDQKVQDFFEARRNILLKPLIANPGTVKPITEEVQKAISQKSAKLDISNYDPRIQAALVVAYRETLEFVAKAG